MARHFCATSVIAQRVVVRDLATHLQVFPISPGTWKSSSSTHSTVGIPEGGELLVGTVDGLMVGASEGSDDGKSLGTKLGNLLG